MSYVLLVNHHHVAKMTNSLTPPTHSDEIKVSFPQEHVMLLTLNRPKSLNAITPTMTSDIHNIMNWFDDEPSLWYVKQPEVSVLCIQSSRLF